LWVRLSAPLVNVVLTNIRLGQKSCQGQTNNLS
jgi:hypothetical protein